MRNITKKILAGILGGALIFTGANAFAAEPDASDFERAWQEEAAQNIGGWAKYFSDKYGIDGAQIERAMHDGVHIEDIKHAAVLSKLSGKNFSDVLAMKVDWSQVADKLGITHDQIKNFYDQERDAEFAERAGIDVGTFKSLLKDGYQLHDIAIAGKIATASGKDIKTVLGKRKINNTWGDVAKSFGVDMKKIMPPPPAHYRDK
ncbi:MAG: hypothetical protein IKD80_08170 [Selenomonadaceae bacterium]|nr:hypothetical protein [Selenomonadaceae bacterium]